MSLHGALRGWYIPAMTPSDRDSSVDVGGEIVSDSRCFVCGLKNPGGLRVRFFRDGERSATASYTPQDPFMGYHGLLHGGVTAALLDEIMIKAVLAQSRLVVTARMSVQYHRPIPLGQPLTLRGAVVAQKARIFETEGRIQDARGEKLASATGTYVEVGEPDHAKLVESIGK
jgi:uncharacterized protein (TIGR00369 family)